jgi:hypothetical protein
MSKAILNMISFTSLFSQFLLAALYTLGVFFYKFNKIVLNDFDKEVNPLNAIESVEYFSEETDNSQTKKNNNFENFDDYSAFSKEKWIEVNRSEPSVENIISESGNLENSPQKIEGQTAAELIDESVEDYVLTNTALTATVQEDDFEETNFDLLTEQENSIMMVDEDDIKRVFQSKDWAVRHQQTNH